MILGILFSFLSVVFGAFGAHALRSYVPVESFAIWNTAVHYQFFHALALLVYSLWNKEKKSFVPWIFSFGILFFSGSLYLLVLTSFKKWGLVTPIGGVLFLLGWVVWGIEVVKRKFTDNKNSHL